MQNIESDNKIILELNLRFQVRNYHFRYLIKKGWIAALLMALAKLLFWYYGYKT